MRKLERLVFMRPGDKEVLKEDVLLTKLGMGTGDGCYLEYDFVEWRPNVHQMEQFLSEWKDELRSVGV